LRCMLIYIWLTAHIISNAYVPIKRELAAIAELHYFAVVSKESKKV
jgi:hypothetical protein